MSANPDPQAQLIAEIALSVPLGYIYFSVIVFYGYDIILKMSREIELMWRKKPRITTFLYIATRYAAVPRLLIQPLPIQNNTKTCDSLLHTADALYVLSRASVLVVLTGQVWAIYDRDRHVLLVLGSLSIVYVVFDALVYASKTCYTEGSDYDRWANVELILGPVVAAIVMVLSLYKIMGMVDWKESVRSLGTRTPFKFTSLAVSEGFRRLIVCGLTILQSLLLRFGSTELALFSTPFLLPLEAILVCRLLLDLHKKVQNDTNPTISFTFSTVEVAVDLNQQRWDSGEEPVIEVDSGITMNLMETDKGKGRMEEGKCV
ncbi:hypothetical protein K439DRAFT_1642570 [Ramaria rubella]|nr:hypothetical protein K439DRAFT_1642570 [Ramaria rubella]